MNGRLLANNVLGLLLRDLILARNRLEIGSVQGLLGSRGELRVVDGQALLLSCRKEHLVAGIGEDDLGRRRRVGVVIALDAIEAVLALDGLAGETLWVLPSMVQAATVVSSWSSVSVAEPVPFCPNPAADHIADDDGGDDHGNNG